MQSRRASNRFPRVCCISTRAPCIRLSSVSSSRKESRVPGARPRATRSEILCNHENWSERTGRSYGGIEQAKELHREVRRSFPWIEHIVKDARYGVRKVDHQKI